MKQVCCRKKKKKKKNTNHPYILLGDFNISTSDLQDKLSNSNLDKWFIPPINGSPISWKRGSYSSDIDHALVNSSMLVKISSTYFVDYPSVSDHKPLMVYCKKLPQMNHLCYQKNL